MTTTTRRPPRSDAKRNCDLLLAAAKAAFAEHGASASLEDIARRAGVGIGTLYRHFPTRDALLARVLDDHALALVARSDELRDQPPGPALEAWLDAMVNNIMTYRGLTQSLAPNFVRECPESELNTPCTQIAAAGTALLARAQAAGAIRPDATVEDLMLIANAVAWAAEQADGDCAHAHRLLRMLLDGLRGTAAAAPLPTAAPPSMPRRPRRAAR